MDFIFDKINFLLIIICCFNFVLCLIIFISGYKKKLNILFGFNTLTIISWILAMIFYRSASQENGIFWCTALYIAPSLIASSFLFYTYVFPSVNDKYIYPKSIAIFVANAILIVMVVIPGFMIREVNIRPGLEKEIVFSPYYWFYFLYIAGFFTFGYYRLYQKYKNSFGTERLQILYILLGYGICGNLSFITNLTMPWIGYFFLNWMGQAFTILIVGFTSYAIIAHRLMDIKLVMRKYVVYLVSLSAIFFFAIVSKSIFNFILEMNNEAVNFFILAVSVIVFPFIKNYFYKLANTYFFSSLYDSRKVIAELSEKLRATLDIIRIYAVINEMLTTTFHCLSVGILTYDERSKKYKIQSHGGAAIDDKILNAVKNLNEAYLVNNIPILIEEIKSEKRKSSQSIFAMGILLKNNIEIILPLNVKGKNIGLILIGAKESKDIYNDEDLQVLEIIGAQAAIAIENALLYKETKDFNVKLKKEIDNATNELRAANEELTRLDETKSEFISIASHQLRTPLTIIKGYVSMMLENNFGKMRAEQKDALDKVYESNERLIRLVENLLNISRIESGRIQYRFEKIRLEAVAEAVFNELSSIAKKRGIKLDYFPPKNIISFAWADPDKVKEIIMNLTDNSIKYTKKGNIKMSIEEAGTMIRFSISDTGMGIKVEDLPRLFQKFNRGTGSPLVHTEGTGLGLYVAKMMVEAQKGRIWAESKGENMGSQFYFELPIAKAQDTKSSI